MPPASLPASESIESTKEPKLGKTAQSDARAVRARTLELTGIPVLAAIAF
jgi:hypothetical protein